MTLDETLAKLIQALAALTVALERRSGPKRVIRDQYGNIVGIEPVNNG